MSSESSNGVMRSLSSWQALLIELLALAFAFGALYTKVDSLGARMDRLEQVIFVPKVAERSIAK